VIDFSVYRFITGLGVAVSLDSPWLHRRFLPDRARPHALGALQALSAVGNVTAGLIAVLVGYLETTSITPEAPGATCS